MPTAPVSKDLSINSKEFFSNYMFHPLKPELSKHDTIKAVVASVVLVLCK